MASSPAEKNRIKSTFSAALLPRFLHDHLVDGVLAGGDRPGRIVDFEFQIGQRFDQRDGAAETDSSWLALLATCSRFSPGACSRHCTSSRRSSPGCKLPVFQTDLALSASSRPPVLAI